MDNSLKISPDEQLGLVKRLYFDQLPFQKRTQQIVREVMKQEENTLYTLSYKTGWGYWNEKTGKNIGWIVGWIEENNHPWFFVLNLESPDPHFDMVSVRMKILKDILGQLGFMKGRM